MEPDPAHAGVRYSITTLFATEISSDKTNIMFVFLDFSRSVPDRY